MTDKSSADMRARRHYNRAENLAAELEDLKERFQSVQEQLKVAQDACKELMKLVDSIRAERDTWRAAAS